MSTTEIHESEGAEAFKKVHYIIEDDVTVESVSVIFATGKIAGIVHSLITLPLGTDRSFCIKVRVLALSHQFRHIR
jgi:hypothetical protein